MEEYSCLKECPLAAEVCNHRESSEPASPDQRLGYRQYSKRGRGLEKVE